MCLVTAERCISFGGFCLNQAVDLCGKGKERRKPVPDKLIPVPVLVPIAIRPKTK
jgi:hypothetical protein